MMICWPAKSDGSDIELWEAWLEENVGPRGKDTWHEHWEYGYFFIVHEEDAILFRLTFGI